MTHLLDTSAILAHYLDEPGADEVESLLAQGPSVVALAAPSWVELDTRLRELVAEVAERENVFLQYTVSLTTLLPVDAESCLAAIRLRNTAPGRSSRRRCARRSRRSSPCGTGRTAAAT